MTVQSWFYVTLAVMAVLVAVGAVIGGRLLAQTTAASDRLIQHIQPARVAAYQLQATLIDQETGERGYALTANRQFLAPYTSGQSNERALAAQIRKLLPDDPQVLADLDRVESAAAQWRSQFADPIVEGVTPGDPHPLDENAADAAKSAFDDLRALFDVQNTHLQQAREASVAQLRHKEHVRDAVLAAMMAVFFLTVLLLILILRMLVIRPLETLRRSTRMIAGGAFDHPISQDGPSDLRGLADDVDSMRGRIMEDLDAAQEQQRKLSELAESLDSQALELRRSNAELEQFAYVASHDLQEPLRKVASFCQLLEKRYSDVLDERGQQYINFAVDGAKRMQVLITDLLTFSRVGRISDTRVPVPLDTVVEKALANLATAIEESGAQIECPDALPQVAGDPTLLEMLWQNLVGNAIKFRAADRPPRISLTCQADPDSPEGEAWLFALTDNGIGIPEEFIEKVFVIFQRLHSREQYAGTGIGLALCRKIVEYHGGRIWIDTSHTTGTRVCFTLPVDSDAGRTPTPVAPMEGSAA